MFVNCRERGQAEASPDFLEAWSVAVLLDEIVQVVEDLALTFGEWQHAPHYTQRKGESPPLTFAPRPCLRE
jgi:hypothetical protein